MFAVELFLRAIIVVTQQQLDFGFLNGIEQLRQNAGHLFVGVLIRCAVLAFGMPLQSALDVSGRQSVEGVGRDDDDASGK